MVSRIRLITREEKERARLRLVNEREKRKIKRIKRKIKRKDEDVIRLGKPRGKTFIERQREKIESAEKKIVRTLDPEQARKEKELEDLEKEFNKDVNRFNRKVDNLSTDVKDFNKKYGDRELELEEFNKARLEEQKLRKRQEQIEAEAERFGGEKIFIGGAKTPFQKEVDIGRKKVLKKYEASKKKFNLKGVRQNIAGAITGIATLPTTVLKAELQPLKTAKSPFKPFTKKGRESLRVSQKELERTAKEDPFRLTGQVAGTLIATEVASAGLLKALRKTKVVTTKTRIKPKVAQSFNVEKVVKVGENQYKAKGKLITTLKDPKTNKVLERIKTQTFTDTVVATTERGAVKTFSETFAQSLRRGGLRHSKKEPKVTLNIKETKAQGEITFIPDDDAVEGVVKGAGEGVIAEVGEKKFGLGIKGNVGEFFFKQVKRRKPKKQPTISNVIIKNLGEPKPAEIRKGAIIVRGKKQKGVAKSLTDIGEGDELIRAKDISFVNSFTPEKVAFDVGDFVVKPTIQSKILKSSQEVDSGGLKQVLKKGISKRDLSKVIARTQAKQVGAQFGKPRTITTTKTLTTQAQATKTSQAFKSALITQQVQKQKVNTKAKGFLGTRIKTKPLTKTDFSFKNLFALKTAITQKPKVKQATRQRQEQISRLKLIAKGGRPTPPTIARGRTPPPFKFGGFGFIPQKKKPFSDFTRRKQKPLSAKQFRKQYQASVGAVLLGVRGKKKPKKLTGLELRPLLQ